MLYYRLHYSNTRILRENVTRERESRAESRAESKQGDPAEVSSRGKQQRRAAKTSSSERDKISRVEIRVKQQEHESMSPRAADCEREEMELDGRASVATTLTSAEILTS